MRGGERKIRGGGGEEGKEREGKEREGEEREGKEREGEEREGKEREGEERGCKEREGNEDPFITSCASSPGLPNISIEDVYVPPVPYVVSNHGLVQPLVVMEKAGYHLRIGR